MKESDFLDQKVQENIMEKCAAENFKTFPTFQVVFENKRTIGIQNTKGKECDY